MYKVFFKGSTIELGSDHKKSLKDNIIDEALIDSYKSVNQLICGIESVENSSRYIIKHKGDENLIWIRFKDQLTRIPAAGGLVRNKDGAYLFIKRLGVWDLPKGKIEKKETAEEASVREVEEECGISGLKIIKALDSTFHIYRSPFLAPEKNLVWKETKWFLMEYSGNQIPVPEVRENIEEAIWLTLSEIDRIVLPNTYANLLDFLKKSLPVHHSSI